MKSLMSVVLCTVAVCSLLVPSGLVAEMIPTPTSSAAGLPEKGTDRITSSVPVGSALVSTPLCEGGVWMPHELAAKGDWEKIGELSLSEKIEILENPRQLQVAGGSLELWVFLSILFLIVTFGIVSETSWPR